MLTVGLCRPLAVIFRAVVIMVIMVIIVIISFQDAHLQPEFQLSGSSAPSSAASAVLGGMVASAPPATLADRHAIFGGPTSPPTTSTTLHQTRSQMESVDIDSHKDASDDFIEIKVISSVGLQSA